MSSISSFETFLAMFGGLFLVCVAGLMLLGPALMEPAVSTAQQEVRVVTNSHAALVHGRDAYRARLAVFNCDPRLLQVFIHDDELLYPIPASAGKWLFVCPNTSETMCAGMVVGRTVSDSGSYPEFTAFVSTCQHWLVDVPLRDGYVSAPAVLLKDAWMTILTMEACDEGSSED